MANKPGSSSYQKGDCGGAHGDYEHGMQMGTSGFGMSHGFGPKMRETHERALASASPTRIGKHIVRTDFATRKSAVAKKPSKKQKARRAVAGKALSHYNTNLMGTKNGNTVQKSADREAKRLWGT